MAQKKQQGPTLGKKISGLKTYKQKISDVNLYQGDINDIWDKETVVADSVYRDLLSKDYTSGQIFRSTIGAPHMSDEDWPNYIKYGKDYKKYSQPKVEDAIIDTMKRY